MERSEKGKDIDSSLKIAIVVDMWLTGFDVPSLATMYVYKLSFGELFGAVFSKLFSTNFTYKKSVMIPRPDYGSRKHNSILHKCGKLHQL